MKKQSICQVLGRRSFNVASKLVFSLCAILTLTQCNGQFGSGNGSNGTSGPGGIANPDGTVPLSPASGDYVQSPLARLSNEEFLASAQTILGLAENTTPIMEARSTMTAEPDIGGLNNDANNQLLKQLTVAGFSNVAAAAIDAYLADVSKVAELTAKLNCADDTDVPACIKDFASQLVSKAYRRDATTEELANTDLLLSQLDELITGSGVDMNALSSHILRLKTVLRYLLLSPDYLLLTEKGIAENKADVTTPRVLNSYEIASRMSYFLIGGPPDAALLSAAKEGVLNDPEVRLEHTARLLKDNKGKTQVRRSLIGWLGANIDKTEADSFLALSEFIDDWFSTSKPFTDFYEAPITVAHLDGTSSEESFGVLGMQAFLDSHTSYPTPAFITRGVFIAQRLLCGSLPDDIPAEALEAGALSDLEVFQTHDKQECASCHKAFDNYGAALHQFDAQTGLYTAGPTVLGGDFELYDLGGITGTVNNPSELGQTIGSSERGPACMAELWLRASKRRSLDPKGGDKKLVANLVSQWQDSGDTSLKSLLSIIVKSDDFIMLYP